MSEQEIPSQNEIWLFLKLILRYLNTKIQKYGLFYLKIFKHFFDRFSLIKTIILSKMLWRRGILSRPITHFSLISLVSFVLIFGSLLGSGNFLGITEINAFFDKNRVFSNSFNSEFLIENVSVRTLIPEDRGRDEVFNYRVQPGDTLSSIAQQFNISIDTILYVNNLKDANFLSIGQELAILPVSGVEHEVASGETLESIASKWNVDAQAIVETNWLSKPYENEVTVGRKLTIPGAEPPKPKQEEKIVNNSPLAQSPQIQTPIQGSGQMLWPTAGSMTRGMGWYYGYYHGAIDIANQGCGGAVVAADGGYVEVSGWQNGGWGITVWLNHGNGYKSRYGHLSSTAVSSGTYVEKGQVIGYVGATGLAYGCHLHFVVEKNGSAIDPLSVL